MNSCFCNTTTIICGGNQIINLKAIFQEISLNLESENDKHFEVFILNNTAITELEDNTFHDITFKSILINNTINLKRISANAFSVLNCETIENFEHWGQSKLGEDQHINELFIAMSSLLNVRNIDFHNTQLAMIPSRAFNFTNGLQNNLKTINFSGNNIKSIGEYAFYYYNNLTVLRFEDTPINHIPVHAFDFSKSSENELYISIYNNRLNDTSIEIGAFTNSKRPLKISLQFSLLTTLDEKIFGPILRADKRNTIYFFQNPGHIECDCRLNWIVKDKNLHLNQVKDFLCKSGPYFSQLPENYFKGCK
jgi:hypothetical protein